MKHVLFVYQSFVIALMAILLLCLGFVDVVETRPQQEVTSDIQGEHLHPKSIQHWRTLYQMDAAYQNDIVATAISQEQALHQPYKILPFLLDKNTHESFVVINIRNDRRQLLQQNSTTLEQLRQEALATQHRLEIFLNDFAKHYPNTVVIVPETKGIETIQRLLETRWQNDASMITDYSRATVGFESFAALYRALEDLKASGLIIVNVMDQFKQPTDAAYRDINIVFRDFSNGHLGEIQFNLNQILDYKNNEGHQLFDHMRKIKAQAKIEDRQLSAEEKALVDKDLRKSRQGYDQALANSTELKQFRVGVYALIQNKAGEILMTQTKSGTKLIYNLPGGALDLGESMQTALQREILEECHIDIELGRLLHVSQALHINPEFPDTQLVYTYFEAKWNEELNDKINCSAPDVVDAVWIKPANMPIDQMLSVDLEFLWAMDLGLPSPRNFE